MRKVTARRLSLLGAAITVPLLVTAITALYSRLRLTPKNVLPEAAAAAVKVTAPVSSQSLYQLESVWTTDHGRTLKLIDLRGRYTILSLIFTRCSGTCPVLVKELQVLSSSLSADIKNRSRFVAITIDPTDTPDTLLQYRHEMRLDEQQWILLRSTPEAVRELTAVLGFNYAPASEQSDDMQFSHSNLLTLLNPRGEIIRQQQGAGGNLNDFISLIRDAT